MIKDRLDIIVFSKKYHDRIAWMMMVPIAIFKETHGVIHAVEAFVLAGA